MYNETFESDMGKAMGFDFKKGFKGNGSLQQFSSLWEPDPDP